MSGTFPVVDCSTGQSFALNRHVYILSGPSGTPASVRLTVVQCPPAPGDPASVAATYTLQSDPLLALGVSVVAGAPELCVNIVDRPEDDPDITAVIVGADPHARATLLLHEDKSELEFILGTDDKRADCLSGSPGYSQHALYMRFALGGAQIALGFDSATGELQVYYRVLPGMSGGYVRLFERTSL